MKVPILQVSLCSTVEWFATFALLRFKEYLHQFRFAQFANKALSSTYFAILALLELCKIICFPSLCSGTKYISTARSARCANKVHFRFNFYGHGELCLHPAFTTRWIKKYILSVKFEDTLYNSVFLYFLYNLPPHPSDFQTSCWLCSYLLTIAGCHIHWPPHTYEIPSFSRRPYTSDVS